jgi:hypothetical protein
MLPRSSTTTTCGCLIGCASLSLTRARRAGRGVQQEACGRLAVENVFACGAKRVFAETRLRDSSFPLYRCRCCCRCRCRLLPVACRPCRCRLSASRLPSRPSSELIAPGGTWYVVRLWRRPASASKPYRIKKSKKAGVWGPPRPWVGFFRST